MLAKYNDIFIFSNEVVIYDYDSGMICCADDFSGTKEAVVFYFKEDTRIIFEKGIDFYKIVNKMKKNFDLYEMFVIFINNSTFFLDNFKFVGIKENHDLIEIVCSVLVQLEKIDTVSLIIAEVKMVQSPIFDDNDKKYKPYYLSNLNHLLRDKSALKVFFCIMIFPHNYKTIGFPINSDQNQAQFLLSMISKSHKIISKNFPLAFSFVVEEKLFFYHIESIGQPKFSKEIINIFNQRRDSKIDGLLKIYQEMGIVLDSKDSLNQRINELKAGNIGLFQYFTLQGNKSDRSILDLYRTFVRFHNSLIQKINQLKDNVSQHYPSKNDILIVLYKYYDYTSSIITELDIKEDTKSPKKKHSQKDLSYKELEEFVNSPLFKKINQVDILKLAEVYRPDLTPFQLFEADFTKSDFQSKI